MIVRVFKTNQVYIYAFIPFVIFALRWPTLYGEAPFTPSGQLPFLTEFFAMLSGLPWISLILSVAAITYQSYILSETTVEHRLLPFTSNITAFILVLSYSVFAPQDWFSPVIFANVFVVLAFKRITDIFHQGSIYGTLFRAGVYISLASLIYLPSVFMMFILFYDLAIIRTFQWREYVISIIGLVTPYVYFWMFYYLRSESDIFFNYFMEPKTFLSILEFNLMNWIPGMIMGGITVLSLAYLLMSGQKRTVRENNLYKVIGMTFMLTLALCFVFAKDFMSATALMWPSVCIVISYFLMNVQKRWIQEGIIYILILSIVFRDISAMLSN